MMNRSIFYSIFLILSITVQLSLSLGFHNKEHDHEHDNFKAKQSKIIKIKEKQKTKEIYINTDTNIEEGGSGENGPDQGNQNHGTCVSPHPEPLEDHEADINDLLSHRTYLLMANTLALNTLSTVLRGKKWEDGDNSAACFRMLFAKYDVRIYGYDRILKPASCSIDNVLDVQCGDDRQGIEVRQTAVWSDGKENALLITCKNGNIGGWKLVSTKREMSPELKARILSLVSSRYGFDPKDYYQVPYEKCPKYIKTEAFEGVCDRSVRGIENDEAAKTQILDILQKGVYTPMSSLLNIYAQSRFLRGISLLKDEEVNHICRKDTWTSNSLHMQGFGNYTGVLYCNTQDVGFIKCRPNDKESSNDHIFIYNMKMSAVWTDGFKQILFVNCLSNNLQTWALFSTEKTVDDETRKFVMDRIEMYGFKRARVHMVPYDECTNIH